MMLTLSNTIIWQHVTNTQLHFPTSHKKKQCTEENKSFLIAYSIFVCQFLWHGHRLMHLDKNMSTFCCYGFKIWYIDSYISSMWANTRRDELYEIRRRSQMWQILQLNKAKRHVLTYPWFRQLPSKTYDSFFYTESYLDLGRYSLYSIQSRNKYNSVGLPCIYWQSIL